MLTRLSRVVLAGLSLALLALFALPLWRVELEAPQYPEGLGFFIWIDRMSGDLQSINGLNHYIGMKTIVPESIPELQLMPWALGALVAAGLVAAAWGRRKGLVAWVLALGGGAVAGLIDFWIWGYDYGHNLDPTAAIKIPGMSYQPPVIGSKQLLNFHATSLPAAGGWIALAVLLIGIGLIVREYRRRDRAVTVGKRFVVPARSILTVLAGAMFAAACASPGPRALIVGADRCEHCHMTVADARFAAQLVTSTGKVLVFDEVGCLAAALRDDVVTRDRVRALWVADFRQEGAWIRFGRGHRPDGTRARGVDHSRLRGAGRRAGTRRQVESVGQDHVRSRTGTGCR